MFVWVARCGKETIFGRVEGGGSKFKARKWRQKVNSCLVVTEGQVIHVFKIEENQPFFQDYGKNIVETVLEGREEREEECVNNNLKIIDKV